MGTSEARVVAPAWNGFYVGPRLLGGAVAGISVWMALMPFVGPLIGIPLDGAVAWQWTVDRVALHVVPGVLGALVGISIIRAAGPRQPSGGAGAPEGKAFYRLGTAALVLGVWMGVGPWLYDIFVPGAGTSGLMFLQVPGWTAMSPLHQVMLESLCHWAPGVAVGALGASTASFAGRRPTFSPAANRHSEGVA